MDKQRLAGLLGATSIALTIGFAASAQGQQPNRSGNENTEVLIGNYYCSVSFTDAQASAWYSFEASGDIFQQTPYLYRSYTTGTPAPDFCDPLAAASVENLTQSGCSVGPIGTRSDESGASREFQFVCHARRSGIIALIAEIAAQHLTESP